MAAEPVDGAVAADGEEPCLEAWAVECGGIGVGAEAEEGILNDIAGGFVVVGDAGGVAGEGWAELVDGPEHEFPRDGLGRLGGVHEEEEDRSVGERGAGEVSWKEDSGGPSGVAVVVALDA